MKKKEVKKAEITKEAQPMKTSITLATTAPAAVAARLLVLLDRRP